LPPPPPRFDHERDSMQDKAIAEARYRAVVNARKAKK